MYVESYTKTTQSFDKIFTFVSSCRVYKCREAKKKYIKPTTNIGKFIFSFIHRDQLIEMLHIRL